MSQSRVLLVPRELLLGRLALDLGGEEVGALGETQQACGPHIGRLDGIGPDSESLVDTDGSHGGADGGAEGGN